MSREPVDGKAIRTARLALRPLLAADAGELHTLWTDPGVRQFLFDGEAIPLQQTLDIVTQSAALFADHGYGLWGVRCQEEAPLVGFCGFWNFHEPPQLELLYGIAAAHWGKGYATEAARALIGYAFTQLGFRAIVASMDAPHQASARVAARLGMQLVERRVAEGKDTLFYRLGAAGG